MNEGKVGRELKVSQILEDVAKVFPCTHRERGGGRTRKRHKYLELEVHQRNTHVRGMGLQENGEGIKEGWERERERIGEGKAEGGMGEGKAEGGDGREKGRGRMGERKAEGGDGREKGRGRGWRC